MSIVDDRRTDGQTDRRTTNSRDLISSPDYVSGAKKNSKKCIS